LGFLTLGEKIRGGGDDEEGETETMDHNQIIRGTRRARCPALHTAPRQGRGRTTANTQPRSG